MKYQEVKKGIFLSRPNRFIAHVMIDVTEEICHVKNTGRCRELLQPGVVVYLEKSRNPARKTRFSLVAVEKGQRLINMDSQAPNAAAREWIASGRLFSPVTLLRPETKYGDSRFDFYAESGEQRHFIEVKGVTLEENGVVRFPDAPTQRGAKHLRELCRCQQEGFQAHVLFVVQMADVKCFCPNRQTDPDFAAALEEAAACGVDIRAMDCMVTPDSMIIRNPVPVEL